MVAPIPRRLCTIIFMLLSSIVGLLHYVPFGVTYEKIGTIQRRLAWPLHKDDTLSRSGRSTDLNIYFVYGLEEFWTFYAELKYFPRSSTPFSPPPLRRSDSQSFKSLSYGTAPCSENVYKF
ncbi:uncharacterized protein C8R40DRAFT_201709 [Lentinula edodes]|uniref:uncharacterized protein n=1 Tax=Lentinula edodes TaxID=5353 RepID=UPI001E8D5AAD|nr:uncharacterized protein C8R40DRAFT_201709 [Lentinula edodes]KAH7875368.1 hypothetical protein C8R40DRAFT_201709 [Lentinula edodes]